MPINFQQVYTRIKEIANGADETKRILEQRRLQARIWMGEFGSDQDYLKYKVEQAKLVDANIRCAAPFKDPLTAIFPPPATVSDVTVIAADGSQINPDRHAAVQFCIINVGVIGMRLSSGEAPAVSIETELLYGDDLLRNGSPLSDGMVAMRRDISERIKLDEFSHDMTGHIVNLTDGTLELW